MSTPTRSQWLARANLVLMYVVLALAVALAGCSSPTSPTPVTARAAEATAPRVTFKTNPDGAPGLSIPVVRGDRRCGWLVCPACRYIRCTP